MAKKLLPVQLAHLTGDLIPEVTNTVSLGTDSIQFENGYFDGVVEIDELLVSEIGQDYVIEGHGFRQTTVTTEATADDVTYSAEVLLRGFIVRDPTGGARTDTTDTATNIIAAIDGCLVGTTVEFEVRNNDGGAAETITVAGGAGVTTSGTMTVATTEHKRFLLVVTNVGTPAITLYSMGVTTW